MKSAMEQVEEEAAICAAQSLLGKKVSREVSRSKVSRFTAFPLSASLAS